jgi:RNA polymerase sigma factor (sigma-70 family)
VLKYLPAARRYVRALVDNEQDAEDITQDVVVRLLAGDFAGADPSRGRFRDLLKVAIRNMVRNYWARQKRRRPVDLDLEKLDTGKEDDAQDPWMITWRRSMLDLAWRAFQQEEQDRAEGVGYTALRLRASYPDDTSQQLAERLAKKIGREVRPDAVRQILRRARVRFANVLISELANALDDPTAERIEDEMIALGLFESLRGLLPADWRPT